MPAHAGIQRLLFMLNLLQSLDFRLRGNDEPTEFGLEQAPCNPGLVFCAQPNKSP